MKILIAEDEFTSQHVLRFLLESYGEVFVVSNGREAVDAVDASFSEDAPFSLIFMDIMMPILDGLEATEAIRELEKKHGVAPRDEATIIMATAMSDAKTVVKAYKDCGATDYIVKPYVLADIKVMLEKLGFGLP